VKTANILIRTKAELGEGPLWVSNLGVLFWVDINKGELHQYIVESKDDSVIYSGEKISCVVTSKNGNLIISDTNSILELDIKNNKQTLLSEIKFKSNRLRFNDGKVDPYGNLWLGTMHMDIVLKKGLLYKINPDGQMSTMIEGVTISNGISWSNDKKTMYYIDTYERSVYAFDFNSNSQISNKRTLISFSDEYGYPDGMSIDINDNIWVAMWGGHSVFCIDTKSAKVIDMINLPVPNVSSCTFGGKDMKTLFITTAREGLDESELKKYDLSGSIFYVELDVEGQELNQFN